MITAVYAAFLALLVVWLSLRVIGTRRAKKVRLGDGGHQELEAAIRAHGNAVEYIPLTILLMALLEWDRGHWILINAAGLALLFGRLLHARGMLSGQMRCRILGIQFTLFNLIALSIANLGYVASSWL